MKKPIYILLVLYAVISAITIALCNGTGDTGDSIYHYLYAKYAPVHKVLYFDHWAKPLYVLLASPFAQFGFNGIKVFNVINTMATIFITYNIAVQLKLKNALMCAVMMMCAPLYYILTFSGLTEPLFALFTALGIYFCLRRNYLAACIIISFLPYVRSEGLIIAGAFGLYLLHIKNFKSIPLLATGSVVYAIAGYFVYHDLLWVFTKIPYATLGSVYGHGPLLHFVEQLINVVGVPVYILFWLGLFVSIIGILKKQKTPEETILIVVAFLCFFIAHTLFWYLGIFNSMGLKRVLLCVMPMIAIIALNGFNFITEQLLKEGSKTRIIVMGLLVTYIIIFPFTPNPAAMQWQKDMMKNAEHQLALEVCDVVLKQAEMHYPIIYDDHYLSTILNIDDFDNTKRVALIKENVAAMQPGSMVIWDSKLAALQSDLTKNDLDTDSTLTNAYTGRGNDFGHEIVYAVYIKK